MVKSGGVLYILDARREGFVGHGLSFYEFKSFFESLENAGKIEVRRKFPLMVSATVTKV
ncbi:hypothetical protein [Geoglobus ahangari]